MPQTSNYGRGIAGYDAVWGETNTKRSVLSRAMFEAAQGLQVTEVPGLQLTNSIQKVVLDVLCSLPEMWR